MKENQMTDVSRVGLYGLTYKENVDDVRESPTLQMLDSMERHLCGNLVKVYDPYVKDDIVPNQMHDFDEFVNSVDFVVIMVGHNEIINNMEKIKDKIVLDTRHICSLENVYRL